MRAPGRPPVFRHGCVFQRPAPMLQNFDGQALKEAGSSLKSSKWQSKYMYPWSYALAGKYQLLPALQLFILYTPAPFSGGCRPHGQDKQPFRWAEDALGMISFMRLPRCKFPYARRRSFCICVASLWPAWCCHKNCYRTKLPPHSPCRWN